MHKKMSLTEDKIMQSVSLALPLPVKISPRASNRESPPSDCPVSPTTGNLANNLKNISEMKNCPGSANGSRESASNNEESSSKALSIRSDEKGLCASIDAIAQLFTLSWDMDHKQYITENDIKFSVQLGLIPNEMHISINAYSLHISSPSGLRYPYEAKLVRQPDNAASKVKCCFRAVECGEYTIDVKFCGISIRGCPFNIYISRDYQTVRDRRPIVSWTLQSTDPDKVKKIKPWGICCNTKTEQIFLTDRENHEVLVYGPDGDFHFRFGKFGNQTGKFNQPVAIAYDSNQDRILISDRGNDRIQIFSSAGEFMSSFGGSGSANGEFSSPWGIAVSNDGNFIAVADTKNRRVQLFDPNGKFLRQFKGSFGYLKGITFDFEGRNIIVSDWMNSSVFKINVEMTACSTIMNKSIIGRPAGLIVDVAGNLLVCDTIHNCIVVLDWKYEFTGELIQNTGDSEIMRPKDITYLRGGFFALLDSSSDGQVRIC